jgi:hypothetical protein
MYVTYCVDVCRVSQHHMREGHLLTQTQEEMILIGGFGLFWLGTFGPVPVLCPRFRIPLPSLLSPILSYLNLAAHSLADRSL